MNMDSYWIRRALIAAGLMTALFLGGAVLLRAEDHCQKRVSKADHKLHEAVAHHGLATLTGRSLAAGIG